MIGASLVRGWMEANACFKAGLPWEDSDVTVAVEKDRQHRVQTSKC